MRRSVLIILALTLLGTLIGGSAHAVLTNDAFADALPVTFLPHSDEITTTGATTEADEPGPSCAVGKVFGATVWFKYQPGSTVHIKANTYVSSFNTIMALWEGTSLTNLTELACNNDVGPNPTSRVTQILEAGHTYYFQVGGVSVATGTLKFRVKVRTWKVGVRRGNDWYLNDSFDGTSEAAFEYGASSATPLAGNWVGHGVMTPWVRSGNEWQANNWFDGTANMIFKYGLSTDRPALGDWDGTDEIMSPGVRRGNQWLLNHGFDGAADIIFAFGSASDFALVGDWDGNGSWTPGVRRGNVWYLNNGFDATHDITAFAFGSASDYPVAGDWDGDGDMTPGVVRGNVWYLSNDFDGDHDITAFAFGSASDRKIVGDWNGIVE